MLNLDLDLSQLMDDNLFPKFYAFKEQPKEEALEKIKSEMNMYQGLGVVLALPFLYLRVRTRDALYLLPGIGSIAGFKWYSNKILYQRMEE